MARTLTLTSPLLRGQDVRDAQSKLAEAGFLRPAGVDGEYGPESARAAGHAHWLLGFGGKLADATTYGDVLDAILDRWIAHRPLPAAYRKRRDVRLAAAARRTVGQRSLDWLRPHVGDVEHPAGSNRVEWASEWYGVIGPWCAMGATRARVEAGSKVFVRGQFYAYVPYIVHDATHGLRGLVRTFAPQQGDLVCLDWTGDGTFDHVETVDDPPLDLSGGAPFTTIGCNTSFDNSGSQSNGGACAERHRLVLGGGRTVFVHERAG